MAVTLGLVEILEMAVPDDPAIATPFDLWIHQAIFPLKDIAGGAISETFTQV